MVTMPERMTRVETKLESIDKKISSFIDNADKKYASKLTEKIVYALVGMVLVGFMSKMLGMW